jgi:ribonuclease Z
MSGTTAAMAKRATAAAVLMAIALLGIPTTAQAAACMSVTLTGTGGPPPFRDLAGPGTVVRYGDDSNNCSAVVMQFDAGRGTLMRLAQLGISAAQINALFFTHVHSDHVEGFSDVAQTRWLFSPPKTPRLDVVCSNTVKAVPGDFDVSCGKLAAHIGDAYSESGETAQRAAEAPFLNPAGTASVLNVVEFKPAEDAQVVWTSGDVKVSAIRSTHIPGHVSYRVDTPAGSAVIGGDASNDALMPPRKASTSDQVERLAKGADILVHSAVHPILAPEGGSGMPAPLYYRQSNATDLGAMAQRAGVKVLMLTHLGPAIGAAIQGPWKIPGGPLSEADFAKASRDGGFSGNVIVGTDLATVRLPSAGAP